MRLMLHIPGPEAFMSLDNTPDLLKRQRTRSPPGTQGHRQGHGEQAKEPTRLPAPLGRCGHTTRPEAGGCKAWASAQVGAQHS